MHVSIECIVATCTYYVYYIYSRGLVSFHSFVCIRYLSVMGFFSYRNVSVWDEPGNQLAPGDIVRLTKGYASIWRHCLTLYSGKNGDILKIGDFCLCFNDHVNMSEPGNRISMSYL